MPEISQRQIKNLALFLIIILISSLTISITIHCCKRCCRSKNKNSKSNLTAPSQRANSSKKSGKTKKTVEIAQLNDLGGNGNNKGRVKKMNFVESTMDPTTDNSKNTPSSNFAQLLGECPDGGGETVNVPLEREAGTKFVSKVNSLRESFTQKINQEYKKNTEVDEGIQAAKKNKAVASVIASVKARRNGTSSSIQSADSDKSGNFSASLVSDDSVFNQESSVTPADKSNTVSTNESSVDSNNQDTNSNGNIQLSGSTTENNLIDVSQQSSCNVVPDSEVITNQSEVNAKDQDANVTQTDTPTFSKSDVVFDNPCLDYREVVNLSNYLHLINTADDITTELRNEFNAAVLHQCLRPYNCVMPQSFDDVVKLAKFDKTTNISTTAGIPETSQSDLTTTLKFLNAILRNKPLMINSQTNDDKPKKVNYESISKSAIPIRLNREENANKSLMSYTEIASDQVQYKLSFNPLAAAKIIASFLNVVHLHIMIADTKEYMECSEQLHLAAFSDADKEKLKRAIQFANDYNKTLQSLIAVHTKYCANEANKVTVEEEKRELDNYFMSEVENYITVLLMILDVYTVEKEQKIRNTNNTITDNGMNTFDTNTDKIAVKPALQVENEISKIAATSCQMTLLNSWYYIALQGIQKNAANPDISINESIRNEADLLFDLRKNYARRYDTTNTGAIYSLDVFKRLHHDEQIGKPDLGKANAMLGKERTEKIISDNLPDDSNETTCESELTIESKNNEDNPTDHIDLTPPNSEHLSNSAADDNTNSVHDEDTDKKE